MRRLLALLLLLGALALACTLQRGPRARSLQAADERMANGRETAPPDCHPPEPSAGARCRQALAILAATVRLELEGWRHPDRSTPVVLVSHGTVLDGRYLVTHNHHAYPFSLLTDEGQLVRFSLYRADGAPIVEQVPLTALSVSAADGAALVLDFGVYAGEGFFDRYGVPSAPFGDGVALGLAPGDEVAYVVWDGRETAVQWATVLVVEQAQAPPRIRHDGLLAPGSSGGGVFYNGVHVGNNWSTGGWLVDNGRQSTVDYHSTAALNPVWLGIGD